MEELLRAEVFLTDPDETVALGRKYADVLEAGDTFLLSGPIGAGKTHFARAIIQSWLQASNVWEDIPSPTFTLVQTYDNGALELWHADLYRLGSVNDVFELGLDDAFQTSIVIVEWPDRLGDSAPKNSLSVAFVPENGGRRVTMEGPEKLVRVADSIS